MYKSVACYGVYPSLMCMGGKIKTRIKQGQAEFDVDLMMVWIKTIIISQN